MSINDLMVAALWASVGQIFYDDNSLTCELKCVTRGQKMTTWAASVRDGPYSVFCSVSYCLEGLGIRIIEELFE